MLLFGLLALMWAVELLDLLLPRVDFDGIGIRPRTQRGLLGIALSPFLHLGFGHLVSNSLPFLLLGGYGGMLYGVLPGQPGISWFGHLCGLLGRGLPNR